MFALTVNHTVASSADRFETTNESVVFSFLKNNPELNSALMSSSEITTILARTDRLVSEALAQSSFSGIVLTSKETNQTENLTTIQDNVIVKTNPADTDNFMRNGRIVHDVQPNETLAAIAASYGISLETLLLENKIEATTIIKPGNKLSILPTTGVSYKVSSGETSESIAAKFKIDEDSFLDANDFDVPISVPGDIEVGDIVTIPLAKVDLPAKPKPAPLTAKAGLRIASAPAGFVGGSLNFLWPTATRSITQGFRRGHAALDISNSSKVPIYATDDGFVEIAGWQSCYGNTIVINHGSGIKTRYAHASKLLVTAGQKVERGQQIAVQGNTGCVRGATGIHLHFEVMKNGVKLNPLSYVRP